MKNYSTNSRTLQYFWKFTRPNLYLFLYGTIGAVVAIIITDIIPPLIIAHAFDVIQKQLAAGKEIRFEDLASYVWLYVGFLVAGVFAWQTEAMSVWRYAILTKRRMYEYIFNHLQLMGSKFHADRFGGALVSQTNKFVGSYDRFVGDFTWSITTGITALIASIIVLFTVSWQYALTLLVVMTIYFAIVYKRMQRQTPYNRKLASEESQQTAKLADMITNVSAVQSYAGESHEMSFFKRQTSATISAEFGLMNMQMKNELISRMGTSSINILAFAVGILTITTFHAPVGTLYLAISYTISLARRLWDSMFVMRNMSRVFGDATEMTEILQLVPEIQDKRGAITMTAVRGDLHLKNVTFSYPEQETDTLFENLDLHIKPGEKVGFVGRSGSGKTTLSKLILRFMDIQSGAIYIDGQDITSVKQVSLRNHIAYVPQEPLLFHRSLAENISYGRPEASQREIEAMAKVAHAHEFIEKLPKGYRTLVGERGVKLSGGQRQRVAIARAMLKNAPILLLDEATSALDSESELLIQDALWKLMEGRTAIVIAHRLSTIQKMDRIIVLDEGKIVEEGTHKELIRQNGTYAGLWAHQSGGFLDE